MSAIILNNSLRTSKLQTIHLASIVVQGNNYSNEPRIIKNPTTASLRRGTGGRNSFNGIVCTIFGATGFVGPYISNQLAKIGTQLIIPLRSEPYFARDIKVCGDLGQVLYRPYDLRDEESIKKCIRYSNVVVNLVSRDRPTSNFSYHDVHVEGARRLARLAKEAGVEKFIHLSDLNASPNPKPLVLKNGSEYLKAKWAGECAVREEFPEATIVRPATIYGIEDRFIAYHCNMWTDFFGAPVLWKKGEQTEKQPIYVADVAAGVKAIILDNSSVGKTYQFVGPKRYKLKEIVKFIRAVGFMKSIILPPAQSLERHLLFQLKVSLAESLSIKNPLSQLSWERIERDSTSDVVLKDLPKLEDLGINPVLLEKQGPWAAKVYRKDAMKTQSHPMFMRPVPYPESIPI